MGEVIPVKVAVKARPLSAKELGECSRECLMYFTQNNQVCSKLLSNVMQISCNGKMFTFDSVFDPSTSQEATYDVCAAPLLEQLFNGQRIPQANRLVF